MPIKTLEPYQKVEGKFVVKFRRPVIPYAKGYMFQLRIGDSSGETMLRYWGSNKREEVERLFNSIKPDGIVYVEGETTMYNNRLAINVNPPEGKLKPLSEGEYEPSEFLPQSERDMEEMFKELTEMVESVKNPDMKKLLDSFIQDPEFSEKFKKHPGAMYLHHGWLGGLIEHTINVTKICDFISKIHKDLDRDLLITGAILHDIGKMKELSVTTNIKTSAEGMLVGHTLIGLEELSKRMDKLNTPENLKLKLKHILASHHGKKEYGTPKEPAFPEALCIYLADEIDSSLTEMFTHIKRASTEDDYVYVRDFGNVYLK
jgi:3'-5' exoribonuclease